MSENRFKFQDYLSFGYLYLLILGILRDSIYYGLVGINIMQHSTIMDVLLSPIAYLNTNPILFISVLLFAYWILIQPSLHRNNREKKWYKKLFDAEKRDQYYLKPGSGPRNLPIAAIMIGSLLLGTGIGAGLKLSDRIEKNSLKRNDKIEFTDGQKEKVAIIGQNSTYLFYVREDANQVSVTPINGVLKRIESH